MSRTEPSQKTFDNIALTLSGGGYRASAFHLGSMHMLDELELLDNVKMMSTASGGTITAVAFAHSKGKESFSDFYERFRKVLLKINVVNVALQNAADEVHDGHCHSLIQIAAKIYEHEIFSNTAPTLGDLRDSVANGLFTDLNFNVTEFKNGLGFRFRATGSASAHVGNRFYRITDVRDSAKYVLLSEVVAASSCFPLVFEPFMYPDDFTNADKLKDFLGAGFTGKDGKQISLPLMDGGIFDNQGIDSIMLATSTRDQKANDAVDLFILSDSDPRNKDMLPHVDPNSLSCGVKKALPWATEYFKKPIKDSVADLVALSEWWLNVAIFGSFALLVLTGASLLGMAISWISGTIQSPQNVQAALFTYIFPVSLLAIFFLALLVIFSYSWWALSQIHKTKQIVDDFQVFKYAGVEFGLGPLSKNLSIFGVLRFLENRVRSTVAMVSDVFLKNVRRANTRMIASHPRYRERLAFNYIYDLDYSTTRDKLEEYDDRLKPTKKMSDISLKAEKYGTNLWFLSAEDLDNLIQCGRITVCYSILRLMWSKWAIEKGRIDKFNETNPRGMKLPEPPDLRSPESPYCDTYKKISDKWVELKKRYADEAVG